MTMPMMNGRSKSSAIFLFSWLLSLAILNFPTLNAQENNSAGLNFHRWGSVTVFNGLPSDSVRAISQTPDGVLWFGTDNGLARFDGRRVQNFSLGEGDANRVLVVKTDSAGYLWIGTQRGAFVYFQNGFQLIVGTENVGVQSILLAEDNFLGTDNGLVLRVVENSGSRSVEQISSEVLTDRDGKPLVITGLVRDSDRLLVGTHGRGVFVYRYGQFSELPSSPRPTFINSLAKDASGKLWAGTDAKKGVSGIFSIADGRADRIEAPSASVWPLEADESGVWAGTARYGLFHVRGLSVDEAFTFENTSGGLRSNTISAIFTDREGVVWIGTNRGVSRYDPEGPLQQTVSDIPNSNFIRVLLKLPDTPLYAGSNRGLFAFNGRKWDRIPGLEEKVVYAIGRNDSGILVGTSSGTFDLKGKLLVSGDTRSIENFGKTYAAIFGRGVVDISSGAEENLFPDETANALLASTDKLWIGTTGHGLFSFDGRNIKQEASPEILKSGTIWKITRNSDGSIWLAGQHGVFAIKDGQVEQILAAEDVRDILVKYDQVWAATTTRGLLHARHDERYGWLVSEIGFEQGLPSEKAFCFDGTLIATNRGIVSYFPHNIAPTLIPIRVLSQRMHDLSEISSTIALDYPQNSLLVEVAGQSSRTFPEEFQYAFDLKNSKGEIIDSHLSNEPQYAPANLKPGEYSIESRAFDRDLNASEPLVIRFSVAKAPFPWTAATLGVLLALALIALVWAFVERRRIRLRNRELAVARLDLANEAERERRRIARDLHDQTLADLRNLMIASDKVLPENKEFRSEIEAVSTEVRRICEDLSPSVLENVGLVAALEFLLTHTVENHRFSANETVEDRITFPLNVQLQIYRIVQEVLTNIGRHSTATLVEMSVDVSDDRQFVLTIRDDGVLFQPKELAGTGRGISNIRSRASLINADVEWKERRKGGNAFSLRIPL